eukprot:Nk52_evm27s2039 gene=Nk52_evmTU27s2039
MSDKERKAKCLFVVSGDSVGVSAHSFINVFTIVSSRYEIHLATPKGGNISFVNTDDSSRRWLTEFRLKIPKPLEIESVDIALYSSVVFPHCPGAYNDLCNSASIYSILSYMIAESLPMCAIGHGVFALMTIVDKEWPLKGFCLTGPSNKELVLGKNFSGFKITPEDFIRENGSTYSSSRPSAVHAVVDRFVITGQNEESSMITAQNLILLSDKK